MKHQRRIIRLTVLVAVAFVLVLGNSLNAQEDQAALMLQWINQARLREGLAPLGKSTLLDQAAQRHAEDLITLGEVTHEGSDGSTYQQRIREARYQAWNDGLMVNELIWFGQGNTQDAINWLITNEETWFDLIDTKYREMGVGVAESNGTRYFVLTFGSRPGMLPIFINDNAPETDSPAVAIRLTNEEAVPMGDGTWPGKAIEVRLSNSPDFGDTPWQSWEPLLPWLLEDTEPGEYAVYAEFRDGAGRTAVAQDTIRLTAAGEAEPTPMIALPQGTPIAPPTSNTPVDTGTVTPTPSVPLGTHPTALPDEQQVRPTWTPIPTREAVTEDLDHRDGALIAAFILQGLAVLLGIAVFLRRGK